MQRQRRNADNDYIIWRKENGKSVDIAMLGDIRRHAHLKWRRVALALVAFRLFFFFKAALSWRGITAAHSAESNHRRVSPIREESRTARAMAPKVKRKCREIVER